MTAAAEGAVESARAGPVATVTAVVVSHDGARWLPRVLDALEQQTRPPDETVVVDTGSRDDSAELAARRLGAERVVSAPRRLGFGAAVALGLQRRSDERQSNRGTAWIWLLHDDSAPAPDALAVLLREAERHDAGVVGPKLREWPSLRRLLEVGVTISGTGHRETGLERGEPDQGQHDVARDVLAVSSAGLLVRQDVWTALAGFDRRLPLFGDDVDFGWRANRAGFRVRVAPEAVVFHLEAAHRGLRRISRSPRREERRAAIYTLLANASTPGFLWQLVRLPIGSLLRVLGLLLAKAPRQAWDELRGLLDVYLRPWQLIAARHARRRTARRPARAVRPLLPAATLPYRHGVDSLLELTRAVVRPTVSAPAGRRARGIEPGPVAAEAEDLPSGAGPMSWARRRPWAVVLLALTGIALWSGAGLLGSGLLQGGALLPAPDSAWRWWSMYVEPWHPVGIGSADPAPPYVLAMAAAGTLLGGQAWLLVDLLMLAAVPVCAVTAHRLARRIFASRSVQAWSAATYALVPVVTGAVGSGRLGTVAAAVLLPVVANAAVALVLRRPGAPAWQRGVRLALWLTALGCFVPVGYPLAAGGVLVAGLLGLRGWRWLTLLGGCLAPAALLGPWLWQRFSYPALWWWEAGLPDADAAPLRSGLVDLVSAVAGGPGAAPAGLGIALAAVAVAALMRTDRHRGLLVCWLVALSGLGLAVAASGTTTHLPTRETPVPVWVGFPLVCWWAGLVAAAGLAADGIGEFLVRHRFGWRQPLAVVAAAVGVAVPTLTATWWAVDSGTGLLERVPATPVPDYLSAAATGDVPANTLVVSGSATDGLAYSVVRDDGTRLGEEQVAPSVAERAAFEADVAALLGNPTPGAVAAVVDHGIGAVYATPPVDIAVSQALDGAPGIQRSGAPEAGAGAWQVDSGAGTVRQLSFGSGQRAVGLPSHPAIVGTVTPVAGEAGVLRLAAPASPRWSATLAGEALPGKAAPSGVQQFKLPAATEPVELAYESPHRQLIVAQMALLGLGVLAALPGRRRHR